MNQHHLDTDRGELNSVGTILEDPTTIHTSNSNNRGVEFGGSDHSRSSLLSRNNAGSIYTKSTLESLHTLPTPSLSLSNPNCLLPFPESTYSLRENTQNSWQSSDQSEWTSDYGRPFPSSSTPYMNDYSFNTNPMVPDNYLSSDMIPRRPLQSQPVSNSLFPPLSSYPYQITPTSTAPLTSSSMQYNHPLYYGSQGYDMRTQGAGRLNPLPHSLSARSTEYVPIKRAVRENKEDNVIILSKIQRGEDLRTTLMIRNIPNGYTRDAFVRIINMKCKNRYNFLYLPMDQQTHCNMGYGYINMVDIESVVMLYEHFNNCKWPHTKSEKICSICYGRLQSESEDLIEYCSDWSVMTADEKYHPLFFKRKVMVIGEKESVEMVPYKPQIDFSMRKN